MTRLSYRGTIVLAALGVVLLSSRPADAQVGVPGSNHAPDSPYYKLATGAWLDRTSQATAAWQLPHREAKLRRHVELGNTAAAARDAYCVDVLQNRILVDEWLIQKNLYNCNGYYPYPIRLDPQTYCAIAQYHTPPRPLGRW